jgi:hypothetical protein
MGSEQAISGLACAVRPFRHVSWRQLVEQSRWRLNVGPQTAHILVAVSSRTV